MMITLPLYLVWRPEKLHSENKQNPTTSRIHIYQEAETTIEQVRVKVIYFIPKDRLNKVYPEWYPDLEKNFQEIANFHQFQFKNRSRLQYDIYPRYIKGLESSDFYDTQDTNNGNPQALKQVSEEISNRLFSPTGDIYDASYTQMKEGEYPVWFIIYEGVGASGGHGDVNATLISRHFLSDNHGYGTAIMYHELAHTFAIPDGYELDSGNSLSYDIMGLGRYRPLSATYISRETLNELGL